MGFRIRIPGGTIFLPVTTRPITGKAGTCLLLCSANGGTAFGSNTVARMDGLGSPCGCCGVTITLRRGRLGTPLLAPRNRIFKLTRTSTNKGGSVYCNLSTKCTNDLSVKSTSCLDSTCHGVGVPGK